MVGVVVNVDHTAASAFAPAAATHSHLAHPTGALHDLTAFRIGGHHGHNRFPLFVGEDRFGILEITGSFGPHHAWCGCTPLDTFYVSISVGMHRSLEEALQAICLEGLAVMAGRSHSGSF